MDKKSPDAFRTISEVADWLGVPTHVLRFWESRFTQVKPVKRAGGRRYYRPTDMELLGGIRKLLHEDGVSIRGMQKLLREQGVKHIVAMSPAIDSDELRDDGSSNVVSMNTARDGTMEKTAGIGEPITPTTSEATIDDTPEVTPDDVLVTADPTPPIGEAPMDLFAFADTTPVKDSPSLPASIDANAPVEATAEAEQTVEPTPPAKILSDLAPISKENMPLAAASVLPTLDEEPIPASPEVNLPPSLDSEPENTTLVDAQNAETPSASIADEAMPTTFDSTASQPIETLAASDVTGEAIEASTPAPDAALEAPKATALDEQPAAPPTVAAPDPTPLPDISHIQVDPDIDHLAEIPRSPSCAVRDARKNGTDAYLPILQALADRLDALSVQMNRADKS